MLIKAVSGESFGGRKIQKFVAALLNDKNAVVIDRWMLKAFGFPQKITDARYRTIENWIMQQAEKENMEPRQVQAALWTGIKLLEGRQGDTTKPFEALLSGLDTSQLPNGD